MARKPEFRGDGWPLCPQCGQDELYCLYGLYDHNHIPVCPTLRCYFCDWYGPDPRTAVWMRIYELLGAPSGT